MRKQLSVAFAVLAWLLLFAAAANAQSAQVRAFVIVEPKPFVDVLSAVDSLYSGDYDGSGMWQTGTTAHSVMLNWVASPESNTNWPYRATAACPAAGVPSNSVRLGAAPVLGTTFTDTAVSGGTAYCYYVTAVSSSGVESSASNTAQANVPLAPATGLSVTVR